MCGALRLTPRGAGPLAAGPGVSGAPADRMRARHGLGQTAARERPEGLEERLPIVRAEPRSRTSSRTRSSTSSASTHKSLAGLGHHDHARPPVSARWTPLGQAGGFELVDGHDHRGLVEPHHPGDLGLGELTRHRREQDRMLSRRDAQVFERGRELGRQPMTGSREQPAEIGRQRRRGLGWFLRRAWP